ncbi:MAG: trypsin-like peptidase domain-containing protein [Chloroflexota bacterium]
MRKWLFPLIVTVSLTVFGLGFWTQAQDERSFDLNRIQRATVFIIQAGGDDLDTRCVGTGTIVRFDGLILTNAHNVVPTEACPGEDLIISMSLDADEPPVPKYRARIAQVDIGLDLALLRIDRELDGRIIDPASLPILPFVGVSPTDTMALDDTLTIVGYPDLGNSSTQAIRATATAFMSEPSGGNQSWVKISAAMNVPGLMSGGGAYNQAGELVGIPTSAPITTGADSSQCLLLEDTNDDGFINSDDGCVPVGDAISVVRPVSFARPLIRSAALGLEVETLTAPPSQAVITEQPSVDRLYFATVVTNNLPSQVVGSAPAGTTSLYLFFDYQNFSEDTVYEVRVSVNGVPSQTFSLPPVRWSGGQNGLWYIGSSGQPWANGVYEFRILVNGLVVGTNEITVGGLPQEAPRFSDVVFGLLDDSGNLQGQTYVLPTGDLPSARFIYRNMTPGTNWMTVWYYNGVAIPETQIVNQWAQADGADGSRNEIIRPDGGLLPGNYRVDLFVGPDVPGLRLSTTGDFVVAGAPEGVLPDVFTNIQFFRAENDFADPSTVPGESFPDGANTIYAQFDWQRIAPGTIWTMQWLVDGDVFYEQTTAWNTQDSGTGYQMRLTAPEDLPDGTYTLNLLINDILLESAEVSVGIGQLEINRLEEIGGLQLGGQIVDADSGIGIEGATFVLITEDFSIADFVWDAEQVYALAVADRDGRFEIDRPLEFDSPYSVYVIAEGYLPITQDGFLINTENLAEAGGSPLDMLIPLTKD